MSIKIINVAIEKNIITYITDYICDTYNKLAIVSGGKRPLIFINKNLTKRKVKSLFTPTLFTNESFISNIFFAQTIFSKISYFEALLMLFKIIRNKKLNIIDFNVSFMTSIEWVNEILLFIEQLDLEDISNSKLKTIEANATIGYDIPININRLLKNISYIRQIFHNNLDKIKKLTNGYIFLRTSQEIDFKFLIKNFDEIIMINPFYLYKSEINIFKKIASCNNLTIFVHGNPNKYNILKELYHSFGAQLPSLSTSKYKSIKYQLNVYSASDNQTQSALIKNIIKNFSNKELDSTAIVILDYTIIQPLIAEISTITNRYNVTTGYQIEKTSIYILINLILEAQLNRYNEYYCIQNIVDILNNSIVRNIKLANHSNKHIVQNIIYNIEEYLLKNLASITFITFKDIVNNKDLTTNILNTEVHYVTLIEIIEIIQQIFYILFTSWEKINSFQTLTDTISEFLYNIRYFVNIKIHSLELEATNIFLEVSKNLQAVKILKRKFTYKEIFIIFQNFIKGIKLPLKGSPFQGIQILGLLETRNLSFDNVFIIGMIDVAIPYIKKDYPLIPIEIMNTLGLKRIEQQLEIQKYHFYRLIKNSKNVHLIYPDTEIYDRSRFIESIIWDKQLKNKNLNTYVKKFVSSNKIVTSKTGIKKTYFKTKNIHNYLQNMLYTYSKINVYLLCRLKFYFMYVLLLDNKYNINYDDKAANDIGNFIHVFLKNIFNRGLKQTTLSTKEFCDEYITKFLKYFENYKYFKFRSDAFAIKEIIKNKMLQLLNYDMQRQFKYVYDSEVSYNTTIRTNLGNVYKLTCKIDRIDQINENNYIILDYKTGTVGNNIVKMQYFNHMNKISRYNIRNSIDSLQLPLYKYIFEKSTGLHVCTCSIYDIKKTRIVMFPNTDEIYNKCLYIIKFILDEINTIEYFELDQQDDLRKCNKCEYFYMCR
ncbi:MAG: PD-(D/E)XK nuclease family protein [Endomicrobium sp.]|jgi:hypothetical protein|nr:PD-(D/E)XK nuclease family protein [Endomicrobium sp.]